MLFRQGYLWCSFFQRGGDVIFTSQVLRGGHSNQTVRDWGGSRDLGGPVVLFGCLLTDTPARPMALCQVHVYLHHGARAGYTQSRRLSAPTPAPLNLFLQPVMKPSVVCILYHCTQIYNMDYLTVSAGQKCRCHLARSSVQGPAQAVGILRLHWGGSDVKLTHVVVGTIQFLVGCWTESLSSSGAVTAATENEHGCIKEEKKG